MSAADNKRLMQTVFGELTKGNNVPFRDSLADEVCWRFMGSTKWTGSYQGKASVIRDLLGPLGAQFESRYTSTPRRYLAEDDYVVVETQGQVLLKSGKSYDNKYCFICRLADGKIVEITEYMDTALADAVLADPKQSAA